MERKLSPSVAAFVVLIAAMLLVGLYVADLDLDTSGVTAQQELLPLFAQQGSHNFTVSYPNRWEHEAVQDVFAVSTTDQQVPVIGPSYMEFTPEDADETVVISITLSPLSVDEVATIFDNLDREEVASALEDYVTPGGAEGKTITTVLSNPIGQPRLMEFWAVVPADESGSYVGRLIANEHELSQYEATLGTMLDTVEPFEVDLTITREGFGSIEAPYGWQTVPEGQSSLIVEVYPADRSQSIGFDVLPLSELATGLGTPEAYTSGMTPEEFLESFAATPQFEVVEPVETIQAGDYTLATVLISVPGQTGTNYFHLMVSDLNDGNVVFVLALAPEDALDQVKTTALAMLESFEYEGAATDGDAQQQDDAEAEQGAESSSTETE